MRLRTALAALTLYCLSNTVVATEPVTARFQHGRLMLEFNQAMQTWNNPMSDKMVQLAPFLPTTCYWEDDTTLDCIFDDEAPLPATEYRIELASNLKTQAGQTLPRQVLRAETERPSLDASIQQWDAGRPSIVISSNQPATVEAIVRALRLSIAGTTAEPRLEPLPARYSGDTQKRYRLALPAEIGDDALLVLKAIPGLMGSQGALPGRQDETLLQAIVNEPFQLRGIACAGRDKAVGAPVVAGLVEVGCVPGENVRLLFSQPLDDDDYRVWKQTWPSQIVAAPIMTGSEPRWSREAEAQPLRAPAHWIQFEIDAGRSEVSLQPPVTLRSRSGATLQPVRIVLHTGDFRPSLRAARVRGLVADGDALPRLVEVRNTGPVTMKVRGLATKDRHETVTLTSGLDNHPVPVSSTIATQALAEGGWTSWSLPGDDKDDPPLQIAAPAFDLVAVSGRRQVLVWAHAWDGPPVADRSIELLHEQESVTRVVAKGKTGSDGTALLTLPDDFAVTDQRGGFARPSWWVRAAGGRFRSKSSVLPLTNQWRFQLGGDPELSHWGVVDRPLYRAGEVVRYHLWQRARTGGRLLRPNTLAPTDLRLKRQGHDEAIVRWTVTPDALGGISGELRLPVHLPDDTYCIGTGESWEFEGSCFYVGTWRTQDLWVQTRIDDRVLRDGDLLQFDVSAGYYSGGPAAVTPITSVQALLFPKSLAEAYPQHSRFKFASDDSRSVIPLAGADELTLTTNAQGRATGRIPVAFEPDALEDLPVFGQVRLTAEVKLSDREATTSNEATVRYARYQRYVGLRIDPSWLDAKSPVSLEAVVIDANGRSIDNVTVAVEVHYLPESSSSDASPESLQHCVLAVGKLHACDFERRRSGRYRITARSNDAAPIEITRHVWVEGDSWSENNRARTTLQILQKPAQRGQPAHVLLKQPHAAARVLFVFSSGDHILGYQATEATDTAQAFQVQTGEDWPRQVKLQAYVRRPQTATIKDGWREVTALSEASVQLEWDALPAVPVALHFSSTSAHPGETVRIELRNESTRERRVVLTVVDDALLTLSGDLWSQFDPHGYQWLGADPRGIVTQTGFGEWSASSRWQRWQAWPDGITTTRAEKECARHLDVVARAACEAANAAEAAADAASAADRGSVVPMGSGAINPIDVSSVESTRLLTMSAGQATNVALLAPGTITREVAPAPPIGPPPPPMVFDDTSPDTAGSSTSLDTITVVGTGAIVPTVPVGPARELQRETPDIARIRTRFADTVFWRPDIQLAPGETRSVEVMLPDNLTRWRAVAWSSDPDDDFAMAEATLEVGLPLEVRLQAPVRVYPGDRSRLAANVRQTSVGDQSVTSKLHVQGATEALQTQSFVLPARGQASFGVEVAPIRPGTLLATATAQSQANQDGVAASVEVASPWIEARKVQAGWVEATPRELQLPDPPMHAHDVRLKVQLLRGDAGLVEQWTEALRDYPHRCWEQILSRAVAAALARERGSEAWPEASEVIQEALDNAAVFQDDEGAFRYFANEPSEGMWLQAQPQVALTAYTVRAFALLRELGYPVQDTLVERAQEFLADLKLEGDDPVSPDERAFAAAVMANPEAESLESLRRSWAELSLPARIAAARALANAQHPDAAEVTSDLLKAAPLRGSARVVSLPQRLDRWMSSDLREQCALLELLLDYPALAPASISRALRAGLMDLYAGGVAAVDTQTGATCLIALREAQAQGGTTVPVDVQIGSDKTRLTLATGEERTEWSIAQPTGGVLQLTPAGVGQAPLSYVAELSWREDAREAQASAVGLALERHYEVLRDRRWQPIASQLLHEGDWIRITLVLETGAPRYFVAVTDELPGGLRPTDLSLGSVGGVDVQALSDPGSFWFDTRRLDPRRPRFYAERLPAGRHEIHYFTRIGNSGDYLAAPALAELMYGSATRARTSSARLRVVAKTGAPQNDTGHAEARPLAGDSRQPGGYDRQDGAPTQPP